eukprot:12410076-Karenia_brevis.AAC.1
MHVYKGIIRSIATAARNIILENESLPQSTDCILTTCARTVLQNDVKRAEFLVHKYALARQVIKVDDGRVKMHSAEDFSL